MLSEAGISQPV